MKNMKLNAKWLSILLIGLLAVSAMPLAAQASPNSPGTNIVGSDGTVYMVTLGGQRRPYTSAGAFLSYGFNSWASVVPAGTDDLALPIGAFIPPQIGKVFCSDRGSDKGTCYVIANSGKIGIPSEAIFTGLGYSFSRALYGDVSFLNQTSILQSSVAAHSSGTLINNNGTVYIVGDSGLLGFPSSAVFASWGFNFLDVVPANAADQALAVVGVAAARQSGQLQVIADTLNNNPVSISSLAPALGKTGDQVTLIGTGFSFAGNTIHFDGNGHTATINSLNSINGSTLVFIVPSANDTCPYCAATAVTPGTYNVKVNNANGTSNILNFTVTQ